MYRGEMKWTVFLWRPLNCRRFITVFNLVLCNSVAYTVLYVTLNKSSLLVSALFWFHFTRIHKKILNENVMNSVGNKH